MQEPTEPTVGNPARGPDFDGDGYGDLAIGVPGEDGSGAVAVVYGSTAGLDVTRSQLWDASSAGLEPAQGDELGASAAWGDFDGDGYYDLAMGAPGMATGAAGLGAGGVVVVYGSSSGLGADRSQLWHQDVADVLGAAARRDRFGEVLMGKDFDGDALDDLAIGVPGEDRPRNAGAVQVLYGTPSGLAAARNQLIRKPLSPPGRQERFGYAIGAGHLDEADLRFELIVSAHDEVRGEARAGSVTVLYGAPEGVSTERVERWSQGTPGVIGRPSANDHFGTALAVTDVDHDDNSELLIGVRDTVRGAPRAGAAAVLYGTLTGPGVDRNQLWTQASPGVADRPERRDDLGDDLLFGDVDGDKLAELVLAVPGEPERGVDRAGAIHVLPGTTAGVSSEGSQLWRQSDLGGDAGVDERFGAALTRGDFNGDKLIDIVIGVPGEGGGRGAVEVLYGTAAGLTAEAHDSISPVDLWGDAEWEVGDEFGAALMAH